jgi:hypothetical protein
VKIVLLGPQRFDPTLGEAARAIGVRGRIATVTAGWQEREAEDADLDAHLTSLGGETINLRLHERSEAVFREDPALHAAYRARQDRYHQLQDFYRIRLDFALEAARVISRRAAPEELLREEQQSSIEAVRTLDRHHLAQCQTVRAEFEERCRPAEREAVRRHREELAALLADCSALCIAGGHVASLLNRLQLFGVAELWGQERPVLAWSGGAMVISEQVVLFHDSPPHGWGVPQILDVGLGLVKGVVPLPNPEMRLRLGEAERMALYARRFAPALCLVLPARAHVTYEDGVWSNAHGVIRLGIDGEHIPMSASGKAA